ncbi:MULTISPECIES: trigger factor [Hungatella]|uniref:Trigger factor n=1 Tax=Hungatella hathewayi TaxID=154046 RepID=A0AA37NM55_9FIRM|nr:trigger factor [Hungatella hathewayi]MBT9798893.1 trigger factor [Hungatella hathewayi]RGZ07791.1 trigger factor [Hungatella hathewayi]GKH03052.1 trigger factor [Hungatella hathewayi]GKH08868.1 trigger factor [Hungatella hathewayi]
MSLQVEKLEKNMAKITVEVPSEQFEKALTAAFNKNKSRFNIPGFRKGKAPQAMVEKMYGVEVLYEDAINEALDATYGDAVTESGLEVVSRPEIDVVQVEKGKELIYTATVAVKPEVTLGEYKGIEVEKASAEVTDEDIEAELKKVQEQNSRLITVEDRAVEDGDQTVIDFEGSVDGTPFEGGKGEDYPLTIGSHSFIDTFEEQLIGKNIGEECEVHVTFPEEYHAKELAGKPAVFKVTVKEIKRKELPELNDEFAGEVSEFETLEEYKNDVKSKLSLKKQKDAATENENHVVDKVVENAQMDIPEPMIDSQVNNMVNDYARRMQSQGLSLEQYMQFTGMTIETLKEQMKPQAVKRIQTRLVLEAIVKAENITVSDEAVEKEIADMAESYKMEVAQIKEYMGENGIEQMKEDLAVQEAVDFLVAEAKLV